MLLHWWVFFACFSANLLITEGMLIETSDVYLILFQNFWFFGKESLQKSIQKILDHQGMQASKIVQIGLIQVYWWHLPSLVSEYVWLKYTCTYLYLPTPTHTNLHQLYLTRVQSLHFFELFWFDLTWFHLFLCLILQNLSQIWSMSLSYKE